MRFIELMGCLGQLTTYIRPNFAFVVSKLRQKLAKLIEINDKTLYRLFRSINSIIITKLTFRNISYKEIISEGLVGYIDALYTDYTNSYSTKGFIYFYDGIPISWISRRQSIIALSSSLTEYIGFDIVVKEGLFLAKLAY